VESLLQFFERFSQQGWTLSTPIQLVGFFDASINSIANSTGFQAHLDKPFAPDSLLKVIKLILRR